MKESFINRFWKLCSADFLSPKDFVRHAVLIFVLFIVAHLAGLREYTSIISGTTGSPTMSRELAALLGVGYLLLYMAAVVLAPMFLIAAALLAAWNRWKKTRTSSHES